MVVTVSVGSSRRGDLVFRNDGMMGSIISRRLSSMSCLSAVEILDRISSCVFVRMVVVVALVVGSSRHIDFGCWSAGTMGSCDEIFADDGFSSVVELAIVSVVVAVDIIDRVVLLV